MAVATVEKKANEESAAEVRHGRFREFRNPARQESARTVEIDESGENGVIRDVLVLGSASRGMGLYPPEVQKAAVKLYEGAATHINHTKDGGNPAYESKLGVHRNAHISLEGTRTDFHFNPKHPAASQLIWDAKNAPNTLGFSHDADCTWQWKDGKREVTSIDKVYGVDLVTRTGTTGGLFEDAEPQESGLVENESNGQSAQTTTLHEELTPMAIDYKEVTVDGLKQHCPELVAKLTGTDEHSRLTEELKATKTTLDATKTRLAELEAKEQSRMREEEIKAELTAAKFPVADAKMFSANFQEQLVAAASKEARAALIGDRMALATGRVTESATPAPLANLAPPTAKSVAADPTYDNLFA